MNHVQLLPLNTQWITIAKNEDSTNMRYDNNTPITLGRATKHRINHKLNTDKLYTLVLTEKNQFIYIGMCNETMTNIQSERMTSTNDYNNEVNILQFNHTDTNWTIKINDTPPYQIDDTSVEYIYFETNSNANSVENVKIWELVETDKL